MWKRKLNFLPRASSNLIGSSRLFEKGDDIVAFAFSAAVSAAALRSFLISPLVVFAAAVEEAAIVLASFASAFAASVYFS